MIELTARRTNLPKVAVEATLNAFILLIYEALKDGHEVNISGFGKFRVHETKGSMGINPRNPSEPMFRPTRKTPKFRAGEAFKSAVQ